MCPPHLNCSALPWEVQQESQLMLTNLRDAFRGQSRSPHIVPFHMLGIGFLLM